MFVRLIGSPTEAWVAKFHYFLFGGILGVVSRKKKMKSGVNLLVYIVVTDFT